MKDERENTEWLNEYPMLKQVNPANAFGVPANYFEEMEQQVMERVRLDGLKTIHPGNGFAVPENYFNELEQNIQSRIAIDDVVNNKGFTVPEDYFTELEQNIQSRIAIDDVVNSKGFTVPEDYFNELEQNIQSRIAIDEVVNSKGFTVPEDYFNELEQNIQSRIAIDELINNEHSFTVPADYFNELEQNIQGRIAIEQNAAEEGFAVPEGYFAALESKILQQTILQPAVKADRLERKAVVVTLWAKHAVKYATAACFALVVGTGLLVSEFNEKAIHNRSDLHKALSKVSKSEIEDYLQLNSDAPTIMENTDPNTLSSLAVQESDTKN